MALWRITTFVYLALIIVEAKRFHNKRETKSHLCDPVYNNTNKIQCYCTKDSRDYSIIRSADCYPTVEGITADDLNWESFNELKEVKNLAFTNSRGITLKYIPTHVFKHTTELVKLEIKYGNIETVEPFAFANSSSVANIMLGDNQIKTLMVKAFAHHKNLAVIGLDMNVIIEINRDVFIDLPSLRKLYLTSNKITTIHDRAFVHLTNLKELEIDRNNIFSLNSETFSGLHNLEKLDLSGNSLEVIGDNTFLPLKNLRLLNLEGNKIQMLDSKAFNGLSILQSLSLAHNSLANIDNVKVFDGLSSLTLLNLKGNQLQILKPEVIAPILKNFHNNASSLDVEDNNFPCDCRLDWFIILKNHTHSPHIKLALDNLKCIPSPNIKEKWAEATEAEKNAQGPDEETQNAEYDYYDDTQLNGKLFYVDMRFLLNCTTKFEIATPKPDITTTIPVTSFKITTNINTKLTTKSNPTTTHKPQSFKSAANNIQDAGIVVTKSPNEFEKDRKGDFYTTSRLVTVSAKPVQNQGYNDQDNMASDEAQPGRIKAHRSIQDDVKETPTYNVNGAHKEMGCVFLLLLTIYLRFFCI